MENQKSSTINPLLSNTSRQFYSRRIAQRPNSNAHLDKILKILTQQNQKRPSSRVKTEHRQQNSTPIHLEIDNLLKIAKVKLENLIKRQRVEWRQLYDLFDQFKRSTSLEVMKMNEVNFLLKMEDIMKNNIKQEETSTERYRAKDNITKRKDGKISLENIKLYKENQILKEQLENFEHKVKNTDTVRNSLCLKEQTFKDIEEDAHRISEEEYSELIRQSQYLKQANNLFRDEKKNLVSKINELKATNENLCEQILKSRSNSNSYVQKFQTWRNIMSMQNEEIISLKRDIIDIRKEFSDLHRKYQNTLKRISKMNVNNQSKLNQITSKSVEIFTEQVESFQRIRNVFAMKGYYNMISSQREPKDLATPIFYKKYLSDKDTLNNSEGIKKMNKEYFRSYKPSFYVYLEKYFEYQGVDKQNFEQINIIVGLHFLTTLRGILDSKHNEYLLAKSASRQFTSLSTFTLSWLCNYKIDSKTRKQQEINTDVCFETIGSFYARLMSNQLNGNWEVITFRQFLLESLTIDELAFYLKARFKIMKGDCLGGSGTFLQICYVNYLDALLLIQELVGDFDYRKKLEEYIKRSVQFQRKKQLIDAHFILRLLLEYYQYQKNKTFSTLSKTFLNFTKQRNVGMPFQSYLKIYDYNFFEISLIEKVEIYQKAFSLGRGLVNLENIFTVLNEEGYLCGQVEKMFSRHVIYEEEGASINTSQRSEKLEIYESFYDSLNEGTMNRSSTLLGLERVKLLNNDLRTTKNLSYETVFDRFQFLYRLAMLNLKKMFHSKKIKQGELIAMMPFLLKFHKDFIKSTVERSETLSILEDFKKKNAARSIFKFYRRKKGLYTRSYLLASENFDKSNKIDQIRKEFTNIIDNIKKKYNSSSPQQPISEYQQIQ